ncbi:MAG: hypothetical protein AAGB15_04045, partial [Pseudomonadota bacterium]
MLEAPGESYSGAARISAMSGRPTVLGWVVHEWLWRGDYGVVHSRKEAVDRFYQSATAAERCRMILRHNIRYVALAKEEIARYPDADQAGLRALGRIAVQTPAGEVIAIDRDRCRG